MPVLMTPPNIQYSDVNGVPLAGGKLFTYAAGTLTPKATYTDNTGTTPLSNPVIFDAAGFPTTNGTTRTSVWLDGSYKFIVQDSSGVVQPDYSVDNVTSFVAGGANTIDINGLTEDTSPASGDFVPTYDVSATSNKKVTLGNLVALTPSRIQTIQTINTAVSTTSASIPIDDTIPQITEGVELMTVTITPKSASSKLRIDWLVNYSNPSIATIISALFQDATANALDTTVASFPATYLSQVTGSYEMTSGTTSATTFRLRIGTNAGTATINGSAGSRLFGGTFGSVLIVSEWL